MPGLQLLGVVEVHVAVDAQGQFEHLVNQRSLGQDAQVVAEIGRAHV